MLNFTEKYIHMTQDKIINGKNKIGQMYAILLVAQDEKKFIECGIYFNESEPENKIIQLFVALTAMSISVHPKYSSIKKELFLRKLLNGVDFISEIGITKLENPNLIIFGGEAWSCLPSNDPEVDKLPPYKRKDRREVIIISAFERERAKYPIQWLSYVDNKKDQWIITETKKDLNENNVENDGPLSVFLSHSFKLLDKEDPIAEWRGVIARENLLKAGLAVPALQ